MIRIFCQQMSKHFGEKSATSLLPGPGPDGYPRVLDYSIFKSLPVPYPKNFTTRSSSRVVTIFTFLAETLRNSKITNENYQKKHAFTSLCEPFSGEKYQKIWTVINTQQKLFKREKLHNFWGNAPHAPGPHVHLGQETSLSKTTKKCNKATKRAL